jgi:hypothetical protein
MAEGQNAETWTLEKYAILLAYVRYFSKQEPALVLKQLGEDPSRWPEMEAWGLAHIQSAMESGNNQDILKFGILLGATESKLKEEKPELDQVEPLPTNPPKAEDQGSLMAVVGAVEPPVPPAPASVGQPPTSAPISAPVSAPVPPAPVPPPSSTVPSWGGSNAPSERELPVPANSEQRIRAVDPFSPARIPEPYSSGSHHPPSSSQFAAAPLSAPASSAAQDWTVQEALSASPSPNSGWGSQHGHASPGSFPSAPAPYHPSGNPAYANPEYNGNHSQNQGASPVRTDNEWWVASSDQNQAPQKQSASWAAVPPPPVPGSAPQQVPVANGANVPGSAPKQPVVPGASGGQQAGYGNESAPAWGGGTSQQRQWPAQPPVQGTGSHPAYATGSHPAYGTGSHPAYGTGTQPAYGTGTHAAYGAPVVPGTAPQGVYGPPPVPGRAAPAPVGPPVPANAPPRQANGARLTLPQFASLRADKDRMNPTEFAQVLVGYGLNPQLEQEEEQAWGKLFQWQPHLYEDFQDYYRRFRKG